MMKIFVICLLLVAFSLCRSSFKDHKLVTVTFESAESMKTFQLYLEGDPIDIWSFDGNLVLSRPNEILFPPNIYEKLLNANILGVTMLNVQNVADLLKEEMRVQSQDFFDNYHNYASIVDYMNGLKNKFPDMMDLFVLGETYGKKQMIAAKIHAPGNWDPSKKGVWISGLQHAREWVAGPVVLYQMTQLLEKYKSGDELIKQILDKLNFHFIPVVNVDGYQYTWDVERLWRKNRRRNNDGSYGVDLNRNWPYAWKGPGGSDIPSSETYRGPSPGSELEVSSIIRYFNTTPNIVIAVDYHSYSQLILRPWQYTVNKCPNEEEFRQIGEAMRAAIQSVDKKSYSNIRGSQLYEHSGSFIDYMYAVQKIPAFTVELRPTQSGGGGFLLPAKYIKPTCAENFAGFLEVCKYAMTK